MLIRCVLFVSTMVTSTCAFMCPEPYVCTCEDIIFNCTCNSREDITITSIYNFEVRHVVIDGCGTVYIPLGSMSHLHLESIELNDLATLNIRPFALAGLQAIDVIRISNVQHMEVDRRGFSGLYNISTVSISNVSWMNMRTESFGGVSSTDNFIIEDSKFGTVESLAFILNNITKFTLKNSHFEKVENMSLLIHGSKKVSFESCTFGDVGYSAFSMSFIDKLTFQSCTFDIFGKALFAKNVGSFVFNKCYVGMLETYAFENVDVLNHIQFTSNTVDFAMENSLFLHSDEIGSSNIEIDVRHNKLSCDCDLAWLWENDVDVYADFIESSFCIRGSSRVSSMSLIARSKTSCSMNFTLPLQANGTNETLGDSNTFHRVPNGTNETSGHSNTSHQVANTSTNKDVLPSTVIGFCILIVLKTF